MGHTYYQCTIISGGQHWCIPSRRVLCHAIDRGSKRRRRTLQEITIFRSLVKANENENREVAILYANINDYIDIVVSVSCCAGMMANPDRSSAQTAPSHRLPHLDGSPHRLGRRIVKHDLLLRADIWLHGAAARRCMVDGDCRRRTDDDSAR
jgi:hypothetical protein